MNGGQFVYNVQSGQIHSYQVNGTQLACIHSGGFVIPSGTITTPSINVTNAANFNTVNSNNGTGNSINISQVYNANNDNLIQFNIHHILQMVRL